MQEKNISMMGKQTIESSLIEIRCITYRTSEITLKTKIKNELD